MREGKIELVLAGESQSTKIGLFRADISEKLMVILQRALLCRLHGVTIEYTAAPGIVGPFLQTGGIPEF